ncbi:hypothetical protein SMC3_05025 [Candidatus Cryosericum hinesii]|jgi:hypothetical protein|uniref:DUF2154 domain-containing protein n=1 Tax=Candidatus Cryosericum hinesii TaxID=2290915 RepID=A0A398DNU7_9BACT|nr:toast rack family protein [Candidatus Cryosericum hinesii]RIE09103.1 hypothetical protein SMC4_05645 [Candidatus Cryosericum hinesii]RIE11720.1 hypothetical protein SMC2_08570 [Candidatus Cryosericum hinesii]RIE12934.1 hypothetical protein SMC3_05025 [Candidatus Cryosericum hinesii]
MIGQVVVVGGLAVLAAVLWRQGAFGSSKTGGVRTEYRSIPREDTRHTDLHVRMGAGGLSLQGGATGLMDADFTSSQPELDPEFVYRMNGNTCEVSITQQLDHMIIPTSHIRCDWHLRCANDVPVTIDLESGAGTTDIDLSTVPVQQLHMRTGAGQGRAIILASRLEHFDLQTGAGRLDLEIRGSPTAPAHGSVHSGVGALQMHIPRTTPTRIHIDKAIGGVNVRGFVQDGHNYTNYAPGATPALDIDIQVGVGEVTLDTVG